MAPGLPILVVALRDRAASPMIPPWTPRRAGHAGQPRTGQRTPKGWDTPLSAIEAAGVAGVNERTIRRAICAGQLPATKHRGAFRISPADLAAWQADYEAGTPPDRAADTGPAADRTGPAPSATTVTGEGAMVAELWKALEEEGKATIAAKDETIGRLDAEVAFLREQLDQRSRELAAERERFDVIQQLALHRIEALTTGMGDQRESAPERAAEPPGRDGGGLGG